MEFGPLRQHILQLAISGQLVEQLDSEPVVEQVGPAPKPDEVPFELPPKWKWVLIKSVATVVRGGSPRPIKEYLTDCNDPLGLNWIRIGDVPSGAKLITSCKEKIKADGLSKTRLISKGSLILSNSMSYGRPYILGVDGCIHDGWLALSDFEQSLDADFFYYVFLSPYSQHQFALKAMGTTVSNLNVDRVRSLYIPLPPIEEQRRIVKVLEGLMGRLDQMGQAYSEFAGSMTEHFRSLMLNKAIRGELVPQLDSEPEVEQLGPAPKPDEVPFELPPKWKWAKICSVGQVVGGATPKSNIPEYWEHPTVTWITTADLTSATSGYVSDGARGITELGLANCSAKLVPPGSVIYTTRGARIGDLAIATKECCTNQGCKTLVPDTTILTSKWAYYALMHSTPVIRNIAAGTTFAEISGKKFGEVFIPIPPIEEQRRIVAKLEEVFAGVEKLGSLMEYA